jgi:hypothetical protein
MLIGTLATTSVQEKCRYFFVENIEILRERWRAEWRRMCKNTQILSKFLATQPLHVVRETFFRSPYRDLSS